MRIKKQFDRFLNTRVDVPKGTLLSGSCGSGDSYVEFPHKPKKGKVSIWMCGDLDDTSEKVTIKLCGNNTSTILKQTYELGYQGNELHYVGEVDIPQNILSKEMYIDVITDGSGIGDLTGSPITTSITSGDYVDIHAKYAEEYGNRCTIYLLAIFDCEVVEQAELPKSIALGDSKVYYKVEGIIEDEVKQE